MWTISHPLEAIRPDRRGRIFAILACATGALIAAIWFGKDINTWAAPYGLFSFELAGDPFVARTIFNGRSMALANVAWILASNGRRVLAIDWDLEAPGLHRYFRPFLADPDLTSSKGVIDFATLAMTPPPGDDPLPRDWYVKHADLTKYATSLRAEFASKGTIDFVPAGRQGPSYGRRVNSFSWEAFYDKLGGAAFLNEARRQMADEYDYVLIDSRTGVSDTSGICTIQMPDALVVCFTLNNQSIEGAASVAQSVMSQRQDGDPGISSHRSAGRSFRIFPVPMRVDPFEKDRLDRRMKFAQERFATFVDDPAYWGEVEVPYIPYYAYEEILAAFGDKPGRVASVLASFERLTAQITGGDVRLIVPPGDAEREKRLAEFSRTPVEAVGVEAPAARDNRWAIAAAAAIFVAALVTVLVLLVRWQAATMTQQARWNAIVGLAADAMDTSRIHRYDPLRAALLLKELPGDQELAGARETAFRVLNETFAAVAMNAPSPARALAFSDDGQLVSGHRDGVARLWSAERGVFIGELKAHSARDLRCLPALARFPLFRQRGWNNPPVESVER